MKTDKEHLKDDAELMLNSFKQMHKHLKEEEDDEGMKIFSDIVGHTGIFIDNLFELHEKIVASKEEEECLKTKD